MPRRKRVDKEAEAGAKTPDLRRRHRVTQQTFYRWKSKYGGLEVSEMRSSFIRVLLKAVFDGNKRLKIKNIKNR